MRYVVEYQSGSGWKECYIMHDDNPARGMQKQTSRTDYGYTRMYFERQIEAEIYAAFRRTRSADGVQYRVTEFPE